jgi:AcrR family transcriptional regulator
MIKYEQESIQPRLSPRTYELTQRQAATDHTRDRILAAAHELLTSEDFSEFTMEAVARKADVSRLTVYYQFDSKAGLLEALYNYIAKRGRIERLAEVFRRGNNAIQTLHDFIRVFAEFWASDRFVIRRLHALGAIDPEIAKGLQARNERRRNGLRVILDRYGSSYRPLTPMQEPIALDTLHMLTSFETFDALAGRSRSLDEIAEIIRKMANHAVGFTPRSVAH